MSRRNASLPQRVSAAALALLLSTAACGKGDTSTTLDAVSPEEAKARLTRGLDKVEGTKTVQMRITGFTKAAATTPESSCTMSSPETSTVVVGVDNPAQILSFANGDGEPILLFSTSSADHDDFFLGKAAVPDGIDLDRPWLQADDRTATGFLFPAFIEINGPLGALSRPSMTGSQSSDDAVFEPGAVLDQLREAATAVTSVGREDVGGTTADHLRLTLDPAMLDGYGGTTTSVPWPDGYAPQRTQSASAEAWVSSDDRVLRLVIDVDVSGGEAPSLGALEGFTAHADVLFLGYDEPLPITWPEPADVVAISDLPAAQVLRTSSGGCAERMMAGFTLGGPERQISDEQWNAYVECKLAEDLRAAGTMTWGEYAKGTASATRRGIDERCNYPGPRQLSESELSGTPPSSWSWSSTSGSIPPELQRCVDAMQRLQMEQYSSGSTTPPPSGPPPECLDLSSPDGGPLFDTTTSTIPP